jgi:hypothetical protein
VLYVLFSISVLLFSVIFLLFHFTSSIKNLDIETVDVLYKALINFVFVTIAGVFLYQTIEDERTKKRHLLRIQCGIQSNAYYISQFLVDYLLFLALNVPQVIMVLIGYRSEFLP